MKQTNNTINHTMDSKYPKSDNSVHDNSTINSNTKDLTIQECFFFFNSTPSIVCICWLKESKRGWLIYKLIYFLQYKPKYTARDLILLLSNFEIYNHNQWKEAYSKYNFIE